MFPILVAVLVVAVTRKNKKQMEMKFIYIIIIINGYRIFDSASAGESFLVCVLSVTLISCLLNRETLCF